MLLQLSYQLATFSDGHPRALAHRSTMVELIASRPRCLAPEHVTPGHFTASAFVLSPDRRRLLLIFHDKLRLWLQPGGHLEPSDATVEAAARREVAEETGATDLELLSPGIFDLDIHHIPALSRSGHLTPAHRHYDVRYLFRARSDRLVAASDAISARWVPLDRVYREHTDSSVRRVVELLLARAAPP